MFFARRAAGGTGEENYQHDQMRGSSADSQLLNAGDFSFQKRMIKRWPLQQNCVRQSILSRRIEFRVRAHVLVYPLAGWQLAAMLQ